MPRDRVAYQIADAAFVSPNPRYELDCLEGAFGRIRIGKEESPGKAAISCLVDSRLITGAAGHDDGRAFVECQNALEIELLSVLRNRAMLPGPASVRCAQDRTLSTTRPDYATASIMNAL